MRGSNGGDQRDVRADLRGQSANFAGIVHAHFEHRELGIARHPREAERHAGMVVVAFDRAMDLARPVAVERGEQRFLGAGLADRAGDAEDGRAAALARRTAERLERGEGVADENVRSADRLRDDRPRSARGECAFDELVTVVDGARHCDEQVAGLNLAAVEGDAGDFETARWRCRRSRRRFRRRSTARSCRALPRHQRIVERKHLSPMIWPVSWPLPATSTMSPSRAMRIASAIASRRPGDLGRAGGPGHDRRARIRAGSSLRGLSSVTMTMSDMRDGDRAHLRPLALVAVAAGAEHRDQPPFDMRPKRRNRRFECVGRVRIIDIDRAPRRG